MLKQVATVREVIEGHPALDPERIELAPLYFQHTPETTSPQLCGAVAPLP